MNKQTKTGKDIPALINELSSTSWEVRTKARNSLMAIGEAAVTPLSEVLQSSNEEKARWEAIKALVAIGDARSIPTLVRALEDNENDIAWLAAEALKKFRMVAWPALLKELIKPVAESVSIRNGVHHVLKNQREKGLNDLLDALMKALESDSIPESVPVAAANLMDRLRIRRDKTGRILNLNSGHEISDRKNPCA